jgi:hypothetical protein
MVATVKGVDDTYFFINIPTPVLSTLDALSHSLVHPEVPVQMSPFLLATLL